MSRIKQPKIVSLQATAVTDNAAYSFLCEMMNEFKRAKRLYPNEFNSVHEGYAVLLEEVEELWAEVKKKRHLRSPRKMRDECIQIATMAMQFAMELT